MPKIRQRILAVKRQGYIPIVYSHAGAGASLLRETTVLRLARSFGAYTVLQIHAPELNRYVQARLPTALLKRALGPVDCTCVLTDWWKARLTSVYHSGIVTVVPNPMPPDLERTAEQYGGPHRTPSSEVRLLAMARLVAGKGVDVAIRALALLPERVRLVIGGDGPERVVLTRLASELGVAGRVEFKGWVGGEDKARLLADADIFCLPSTYDAFPMSMVEAMAYGIPVVAARWGGIPDVVPHGRAGFLADAPEPECVAEAVRPLLDAQLRARTGEGANAWVRQLSSSSAVGNILKDVFGRTIKDTQ
ncbi:MAG: glycosyltransferase family 4 protein [Gammaproteobacteria bacterium]